MQCSLLCGEARLLNHVCLQHMGRTISVLDGKQGLQATACLQRQQAFAQKLNQLSKMQWHSRGRRPEAAGAADSGSQSSDISVET